MAQKNPIEIDYSANSGRMQRVKTTPYHLQRQTRPTRGAPVPSGTAQWNRVGGRPPRAAAGGPRRASGAPGARRAPPVAVSDDGVCASPDESRRFERRRKLGGQLARPAWPAPHNNTTARYACPAVPPARREHRREIRALAEASKRPRDSAFERRDGFIELVVGPPAAVVGRRLGVLAQLRRRPVEGRIVLTCGLSLAELGPSTKVTSQVSQLRQERPSWMVSVLAEPAVPWSRAMLRRWAALADARRWPLLVL